MNELLEWYALLARSKYFRWARLWGAVTAILIGVWCWCVAQGEWGWVLTLVVPIFITGSIALEGLAKAYLATYLTRQIAPQYLPQSEAAPDEAEAAPQAEENEGELSAEDLRLRANFYAFVWHVTKQNIVGEGAWKKRGLSVPTYQRWIKTLKAAGVVSTPPAGAAPRPLLGLEEALARLAEWGDDPDYWLPVIEHYHPAGDTTLLLIQDTLP
jgi:hypothetical protein